jgi:hypothetical protein
LFDLLLTVAVLFVFISHAFRFTIAYKMKRYAITCVTFDEAGRTFKCLFKKERNNKNK